MQDLQDSAGSAVTDKELLTDFEREVWAKAPHIEEGRVVNGSPLVDLTQALKDCAREEYGLDINDNDFTLFGKLEASLPGNSVKVRAAVQIIHEAISSGRLKRGQIVFEATSGNFGIALGQLAKLGIPVVALVSRKLQEGVREELEASGAKTVNLDVEICPAPGVEMDPNELIARMVADNLRGRFADLGFDLRPFDRSRQEIEQLLGRQDVINLAKLLARAYGGFCPAQYENELNARAHENVTGPEIEQQLERLGLSIRDFKVMCAFGTGGTSSGLSRFIQDRYRMRSVHVVFPVEGQDVAGIRTRSTASGLRFYEPELYAGQHEIDFEQARRLLRYMVKNKGLDIGEGSALTLYAVLQMVNFGIEGKYLVILADGVKKYRQSLESDSSDDLEGKLQVTVEQARAHPGRYGAVVWTHPGYIPNEEGIRIVTDALDGAGTKIEVAPAAEVAQAVAMRQVPPTLKEMVEKSRGRVLLVCLSGNASLKMARLFSEKGIKAQSLFGGISMLAQKNDRSVLELVRRAS